MEMLKSSQHKIIIVKAPGWQMINVYKLQQLFTLYKLDDIITMIYRKAIKRKLLTAQTGSC